MFLLFNGKIFSQDSSPTAIAIKGDRIIAVGTDAEILNLSTPDSKKTNLNGKSVLPGLVDSHLHLELYASSLQQVDCETLSREDCLDRVKKKALSTPPNSWILGHGWNQNLWQNGFGNARELDQVSDGHPVFLTDKSIHSAWVNSRALEIAGMTKKTPDPEGGIIQRSSDGTPTGILFENAVLLVEKLIPVPNALERKNAIIAGMTQLNKYGLTGVHDFDQASCFSTLQELDQEGLLNLRVVKSIPHENLDQAIQLGLRSDFGSPYLRIGSVKLFADGALGPQTAAMLSPYENHAENKGTLLLNADEVFEIGIRAAQSGLSLAIHAIGDRATNEVLNGLAMLREYESRKDLPPLRHRVEHLQLLHPDDLSKAAQMNVIASMQPIHATSDMFTADKHWGKRARFAYPFASLIRNNTLLTFGSDAPVESPNPFPGIHAAVTRRRINGDPGIDGWYPDEKISLQQAIDGFTVNPARTSGTAASLGQLKPGFMADLIVLDQDPFEIDPQELHTLSPSRVMVGGKWVYHSK